LIASEFVSTVLALILVYFFVRAYRLLRSSYLLGLPVGFSFLVASYVVKQATLASKAMPSLLGAPFAFSIYWVGQYSLLIWGVDGSQTAFVSAYIARLVALVIFIYVFYSSGRGFFESREAS